MDSDRGKIPIDLWIPWNSITPLKWLIVESQEAHYAGQQELAEILALWWAVFLESADPCWHSEDESDMTSFWLGHSVDKQRTL